MIHVLIVNPVRLIAELMETILKHEPDICVIGCAIQIEEALRRADACDVMVVSAALANNGALKLIRTLNKNETAPRVIIVGAPDLEPETLQFLEAGAAGCVHNEDSADALLRAVRAGARREAALSPRLAARVMQRVSELAARCRQTNSPFDAAAERPRLTRREREVLRLVAQGCRNQDIARQLTIELGTAKNHVHNILDKLRVSSRQDAVACWRLATNQF